MYFTYVAICARGPVAGHLPTLWTRPRAGWGWWGGRGFFPCSGSVRPVSVGNYWRVCISEPRQIPADAETTCRQPHPEPGRVEASHSGANHQNRTWCVLGQPMCTVLVPTPPFHGTTSSRLALSSACASIAVASAGEAIGYVTRGLECAQERACAQETHRVFRFIAL